MGGGKNRKVGKGRRGDDKGVPHRKKRISRKMRCEADKGRAASRAEINKSSSKASHQDNGDGRRTDPTQKKYNFTFCHKLHRWLVPLD